MESESSAHFTFLFRRGCFLQQRECRKTLREGSVHALITDAENEGRIKIIATLLRMQRNHKLDHGSSSSISWITRATTCVAVYEGTYQNTKVLSYFRTKVLRTKVLSKIFPEVPSVRNNNIDE